jgi:NADH:quinone reductase (non-electrogenic)
MTDADVARGRPLRVVVLGAGFAGLEAVRALAAAPVQVTVVDRRNVHLFQPLLYQVATASLSAADIAAPIRRILRRQRNVRVLLGTAERVVPERRVVALEDGQEVPYDRLVVATGLTHDWFGHEAWSRFAAGLKTVEDAYEIRRRVLLAFERAEREDDPDRRRALLTFAIVGGGPTGVELAGALAEIARRTLVGDYRGFDPRTARVVLVEAEDRVLPGFPADLSAAAEKQLRRLGVEVRTGARVTGIDARGVRVGEDEVPARTVLWAAGVRATAITRTLGVPLDRMGRVKVAPDLSVPGHPEILVVGDLAAIVDRGKEVPGMAPAAMQEGHHAALAIRADLKGRARRAFHYRDKGLLATVGKASAVVAFGRHRFSGLLAWLLWVAVHIFFLIGFRNRAVVLFTWAWAYVSDQRSARLITGGSGTESDATIAGFRPR